MIQGSNYGIHRSGSERRTMIPRHTESAPEILQSIAEKFLGLSEETNKPFKYEAGYNGGLDARKIDSTSSRDLVDYFSSGGFQEQSETFINESEKSTPFSAVPNALSLNTANADYIVAAAQLQYASASISLPNGLLSRSVERPTARRIAPCKMQMYTTPIQLNAQSLCHVPSSLISSPPPPNNLHVPPSASVTSPQWRQFAPITPGIIRSELMYPNNSSLLFSPPLSNGLPYTQAPSATGAPYTDSFREFPLHSSAESISNAHLSALNTRLDTSKAPLDLHSGNSRSLLNADSNSVTESNLRLLSKTGSLNSLVEINELKHQPESPAFLGSVPNMFITKGSCVLPSKLTRSLSQTSLQTLKCLSMSVGSNCDEITKSALKKPRKRNEPNTCGNSYFEKIVVPLSSQTPANASTHTQKLFTSSSMLDSRKRNCICCSLRNNVESSKNCPVDGTTVNSKVRKNKLFTNATSTIEDKKIVILKEDTDVCISKNELRTAEVIKEEEGEEGKEEEEETNNKKKRKLKYSELECASNSPLELCGEKWKKEQNVRETEQESSIQIMYEGRNILDIESNIRGNYICGSTLGFERRSFYLDHVSMYSRFCNTIAENHSKTICSYCGYSWIS